MDYRLYATKVVSRHLYTFFAEEKSVRCGCDIESLHRMRVASRRLRAVLRTFWGVFPEKKAKKWRKAIRVIGRVLGVARQLDIQLRFLSQATHASKNPAYAAGVEILSARLKKSRAQAQKKIILVLDDVKVKKRLAGLRVYLKKSILNISEINEKEFGLRVKELVLARINWLLRYEPYVARPEKTKELHRMRVAAKNLRYTLEVLKPLYGRTIESYIRAARTIQDVLGDLHELDVWLQFLPEVSGSRKDNGMKKTALCLEAHCAAERARTYKEFVVKWNVLLQRNAWEKLKRAI